MEPRSKRYAAKELKHFLIAQGRRQDWLAVQADISPALLTLLLKGERTVSEAVARRLASALQVPFFLAFELSSETNTVTDETEAQPLPA